MHVVARILFQYINNKVVRCIGFYIKFPSVQTQEDISREERHAFIAVHKRMIHDQRFKQGGGHLRDILVVTGSRPVEGAFQQT